MPTNSFLLDTNVCIHLVNGTAPSVAARMARHAPDDIMISSVVKAELLYGARISAKARENLRLISRFVAPFAILPFDDACAERYALIRSELKRRGEPIGPNDLLIAATALAYDLSLVTHDVREFARVPGLLLEDWEDDAS